MSAIRERQLAPASPKILVIRQAHPALTALLVNAARNAQLHRVTSPLPRGASAHGSGSASPAPLAAAAHPAPLQIHSLKPIAPKPVPAVTNAAIRMQPHAAHLLSFSCPAKISAWPGSSTKPPTAQNQASGPAQY